MFQPSSTEIHTSEISSAEVTLRQLGVDKYGIFQTNSSQLTVNIKQPTITEVSFPASLALQQFFNIDIYKTHSYTLQNTTVPSWAFFLTGTTPFNLNIEVVDLPTGHPTNSDTDANGLGWCIDPTP